MPAREGVIKYGIHFEQMPIPIEALDTIANLDYMRAVLREHGLVGQDPLRYGGFGFGNLSSRLWPGENEFVITASQTGALDNLDLHEHYAIVTDYDLNRNRLLAYGRQQPSSEAMTHAAAYEHRAVGSVIHGHSPDIWQAADALELPSSSAEVTYGTPEMAREVVCLLDDPAVMDLGIIAMLGHEDGILSFGRTSDDAGLIMLDFLRKARDLNSEPGEPQG